MKTRVSKDPAEVFVDVGVHGGVPIEVRLAAHDGESAWLHFGGNEALVVNFADAESLDRLAGVAAEGARLLRERIEQNRATARNQAGEGTAA